MDVGLLGSRALGLEGLRLLGIRDSGLLGLSTFLTLWSFEDNFMKQYTYLPEILPVSIANRLPI